MFRVSDYLLVMACTAGLTVWAGALLSADESAPKPKAQAATPEIASEDLQFFEAKIRPTLVAQCYNCHSEGAAQANRLKGGLLVDNRAGLLQGGDSGPAIDLEHPEKSRLLEAIRYESLQMPPGGKLPANVIADFERWISRGSADPRDATLASRSRKEIDLEAGRQHWSYRPIKSVPIPDVRWSRNSPNSPVDAFVLTTLRSKELDCSLEAERGTLIRRAYFDLIGLPPNPEEIDDFLADISADAYERLIDRLLASPQFGERWGRHWLSVARFGESLTLRGMILPEAWRYRDYVIDTFNEDRPFREFIIEQLAGDLLVAESLDQKQRQLIATTFLTLGNVNLEEQDKGQLRMDVVDDQLDAICKGFLAQTVTCARCHDHKFDPIPTRDYYAMAGILANTKTLEDANVSKWLEFPLPLKSEHEAIFAEREVIVAVVSEKIKATQEAIKYASTVDSRTLPAAKVLAAIDLPGIIVDDRQAKIVGDWEKSQQVKPYIADGYLHDRNAGKGSKTITLLPELPKAGKYEVRLAYTAGDNRSDNVPVTIFSADGEKNITVNQKLHPPIDDLFVSLGQYRFELNGQGFVIVSTEGTQGHVIVDAVQFLPVESLAGKENATEKLASSDMVKNPDQQLITKLNQELKSLQQEYSELQQRGPHRPMYMSVQEEKEISDIPVHVRGSVHNQGERVPRGFLQVALTTEPTLPSATQSGRKELGEWIGSSDNPLTPRVLSNRVWYWLFGTGLVRTPDNFGTTGETPLHPELLDYLAGRLLERNWSVKQLVREVVLSRAYRQTSSSRQGPTDPENHWLSHQNRRRLDPECLLDAILTVSGRLEKEIGGNTIRAGTTDDYNYQQQITRRAVYWPVFRNSLPEIFEVFDFANPSIPTGIRHTSTVATQALFALNDAWVTDEARFAANKLLAERCPDVATRVHRIFRVVLGRLPSQQEARLAADSLKDDSSQEDWARLIHALFATIDFRYVE